MTTYIYKAKKNASETVAGKINASSEDEAIDLINQLGLLPIAVEEEEYGSDASIANVKKTKIRSREVYLFSRQLANLLKSGVTILKALSIIEDQTTNLYFKSIISKISMDIKNGRPFSDALADFPKVYSPLYITMVKAGEESGNLHKLLISVAEHQLKQAEILSKVRTALIYPVIMLMVGAGTVYFVLTFALPKMATLFNNLGSQLPLPTVILLSISGFLSKTWLWVLIGVLAVAAALQKWLQTSHGRATMSNVLLNLPVFGSVVLKSELARFSRTLSLLLNSGVPIIKALKIAIPILTNNTIKEHLTKCQNDLTSGGSFGDSLRQVKEIPSMFGHLISVGEETGSIETVLREIADNYEQETNEQIKIMTTLLEPLMILFIGLIIGFIVFAMLLPVFQIDVLAT